MNGIEYNVQTGETIEFELDIELPNPRIYEIQERIQTINIRFAAIDQESIRPVRAQINGTASTYDTDKLQILDTEATTLRAELIALHNELTALEQQN